MSTPLAVRVRVALGADRSAAPYSWEWTDATQWVLIRDNIGITVGRPDDQSNVTPSTCRLTVDNTDGRWVARNPAGPWYGRIRRGTPLQVVVDSATTVAADTFTRAVVAGWGSADTGGAWTNFGNGATVAADFDVTGSAATHEVTAAATYRSSHLAAVSARDVDQTVTVTCAAPTGGPLEPANLLFRRTSATDYYLARVTVAVGGAVTASLHQDTTTVGGSTLATAVVTGLTHAAATPLKVRAQLIGTGFRMRVWQGATEPTRWHVEYLGADVSTAGAVGIRTGRDVGNTNAAMPTATYDNYTATVAYPNRFDGYLDELPLRWDKSGNHAFVPAAASGVLRRLEQGQRVNSAVKRQWTHPAYAQPVAYWPMEDGDDAAWFAASTNSPPIMYTQLDPGGSSAIVGSEQLPLLGADPQLSGVVPPYTATGKMAVRFALYLPTDLGTAEVYPLGWQTTGLLGWRVTIKGGAPSTIQLEAISGATDILAAPTINFDIHHGLAWLIEARAVQNGADIDWALRIASTSTDTTVTGTEPGRTVGTVLGFSTAASTGLAGATIGHIAIYDDTNTAPGWNALNGWVGESCAVRIWALCVENDIPTDVDPFAVTEHTGPQPAGSVLDLIREAEAVDGGLLIERNYGLSYLTRTDLYNQTVAMTLNCAAGEINDLAPVDDDRRVRNDWEVQRKDGARARAFDPDHIAAYGLYDDSVSLNFHTDLRPLPHAQWRLHLGTTEELQYRLGLNLVRSPARIPDWVRCAPGSRIQVTNPPPELPPDPIDVHLDGYTETIGPYTWLVQANTSPAGPWQVAVIGGAGNTGRLDTSGSTLAGAVTTTGTALSVTVTGNLWSTVDEPYDIEVGGERMTVTACTGTSSPQSFTVTRSVNGIVKAHAAGAAVALWRPSVLAL